MSFPDEKAPSGTNFDVIIIGAGISGINAAYRLQSTLPTHTYTILESRGGIGGTWDFFKYPGIRSDSDLHTFGFPWRPWQEQKTIADGASIAAYINETASIHGIDRKVRFHHKMKAADWSSEQQAWRLSVDAAGEAKTFNAKFIILASGYYDYENPLPASIPGLGDFRGTVVHPQFWPSDLDYADKNIIIIGSGATAVTLLPSLAKTAAHVTMLQRSPGYLINMPQPLPSSTDTLAHRILPSWVMFKLVRLKFLILPLIFFNFCKTFPNAARKVMKKRTLEQLPANVPHDPHFNPRYNPWEQRMCVCPDGDFFQSLHEGKAEVATGHIDSVTSDGIRLKSGQQLKGDIIVTATGLKVQMVGGARLSVDGDEITPGDKYLWKGSMLQDLPNAAFVVGYTNASWTLGADATAQHVTRLLKHMQNKGFSSVVARVGDGEELESRPLLDLNSSYVTEAKGVLPKAGNRGPWVARSNYFWDLWQARWGSLETGLQFYRVST